MNLEIRQFRGITHAKYNFESSKVTLIRGKSGKGKSTIFNAIAWCFFGNIQKIQPKKLSKKERNKVSTQVWVTVPFRKDEDVVLYRQTNPKLIRVTRNNQILNDQIAQDWINDWLGGPNFWNSTSYLQQKTCNPLLFGSTNEKIELITTLAFQSYNPRETISTLDEEIKKCKLDSTQMSIEWSTRNQLVQSLMKEWKITSEDVENPIRVTQNIETMMKNLYSMEKTVKEYNTIRENLPHSLEEYSVQKLDNELNCLNGIVQLLGMLPENFSNESALELVIEKGPTPFTQEEIMSFEVSNDLYNRGLSHSKECQVEYLQDSINIKIVECEKKLEYHTKLSKLKESEQLLKRIDNELDILEQKLDTSEKIDCNLLKSSLADYQQELAGISVKSDNVYFTEEYREMLKLLHDPPLTCPKCDEKVRLHLGKLVVVHLEHHKDINRNELLQKVEDIENAASERLNFIKFEISKINKILFDNTTSCAQLSATLNQKLVHRDQMYENYIQLSDECAIRDLSIENPKIIECRLRKLRQIIIFDPPKYNPNVARIHNISLILKELKEKYNYTLDSKCVNISICGLENQKEMLRKSRNIVEQWGTLKNSTIPSIEEIETLKMLIKECQDYQQRLPILKKLKDEYQLIKPLKEQLDEVDKRLLNLGKLRQIMIDSEYASYEKTSELFNASLSEVVQSMFFEPVRVNMNMFKILKTKNRVVPSVNLQVWLEGMELDVDEPSWGQKERISIALTIAMTNFSSSPFIMMDEPLASLSEEDRELALKTLIRCCKDKTFLYIGHDTTLGWFDRIVDLNE